MADGEVTGDLGTDTLRSIEAAGGTDSADVYIATGFGQIGALNVGNNGTLNEFEGVGGNDTITGNGNTRLAFRSATAGVTVDFADGTATGDASVGSDTITGGVNAVSGSNFADMILGDGANNQILGNDGNDRIDGRSGNDSLIGGAGTDTFVFDAGFGQDTITDFIAGSGAGHDVIEFDQAIFADFDAVLGAAANVGSNVVITAGADKITIVGITKASLTVDDFQFV
jgi:Ca2+-binding RTX toxin-like protein